MSRRGEHPAEIQSAPEPADGRGFEHDDDRDNGDLHGAVRFSVEVSHDLLLRLCAWDWARGRQRTPPAGSERGQGWPRCWGYCSGICQRTLLEKSPTTGCP